MQLQEQNHNPYKDVDHLHTNKSAVGSLSTIIWFSVSLLVTLYVG